MKTPQSKPFEGLKNPLQNLSKNSLVWILFGASLSIRLIYWWIINLHSPMESLLSIPHDTQLYIQLTQDLYNFNITNESILYSTGFGYSSFLTALLLVSGKSFHFALFFQIVLSALSSVLLYKIGAFLTGKRTIGFIAGLVHTLSITSIVLSVSFLSETFFFFLICLALIYFIRILEKPQGLDFILLGLLLAYAIFTRSVAQLLPVMFLILSFFLTRSMPKTKRLNVLKRATGGVIVSIILVGSWAFRNYVVHDTFVVAATGPGAAASYLVPRIASERSDNLSKNLSVFYYREKFTNELNQLHNNSPTSKETNDWYSAKVKEQFTANPFSFLITYLGIVVENILAVDQIAQMRTPGYEKQVNDLIQAPSRFGLSVMALALAALGLVMLIAKKMTLPALLLSSLYLYFAGLSGFTFWQGSRILFPALLPLSLLMAIGIYYPLEHLKKRFNWNWANNLHHLPKRLFQYSKYSKVIVVIALGLSAATCASLLYIVSQLPTYQEVDYPIKRRFLNSITIKTIYLEHNNIKKNHIEENYGKTNTIIINFDLISELTDNYNFFLHIYPESGASAEIISQDFTPSAPATSWPIGQQLRERFQVDLEAGKYTAQLGLKTSNGHYVDSLGFNFSVK